ncbi:hypothetical protein EUX98_g4403 [Antrodiella citrinella]|uniref:AttH domain-containing protein n=1 Tax=Antrodiella citrinella TaxID=2447956 RepID=A0A4S4MU43_9APHY|nr:hypothetical protein EUX98_g4403 [Antrodiella citrinella]
MTGVLVFLLGIHVVGAISLGSLLPSSAQSIDRQYLTPPPTTHDTKTAWWWMHAVADENVGGKPAVNIQLVFYQGLVFPPPAGYPRFHVDVSGVWPNGTYFTYTAPATSTTVTTLGNEVTGTWEGAGSFISSPGMSYKVTLLNDVFQGTVLLESAGPEHYSCDDTTSALFSGLVPEGEMSAEEDLLFNHLGWAVSVPGGRATVSLVIQGHPLVFTGTGYHDQNHIDTNYYFSEFVSDWYYGQATVGPYVFSYLKAKAFNSNRTVTTGFLARNGVVLQNQCSTSLSLPTTSNISSVDTAQAANTMHLTPVGVYHSNTSDVDVPLGYTVDYLLSNGEKYSFTLMEVGESVDLSFYHRSLGVVTGGKVGEAPWQATTFFEWLNPGFNVYDPVVG